MSSQGIGQIQPEVQMRPCSASDVRETRESEPLGTARFGCFAPKSASGADSRPNRSSARPRPVGVLGSHRPPSDRGPVFQARLVVAAEKAHQLA